MTTTPRSSTRTTQRQALVMIAYTFALALGAAVPFAVSYTQDARPATQRRVRSGGYREASPTAPEAPAASSDRPRSSAAHPVPCASRSARTECADDAVRQAEGPLREVRDRIAWPATRALHAV